MTLKKIVVAIFVGLAILFTPKAFEAAKEARGYDAIGGEYLIIPLAIMIAVLIFTISETWRDFWPAETGIACGEEVDEDGSRTSPDMF